MPHIKHSLVNQENQERFVMKEQTWKIWQKTPTVFAKKIKLCGKLATKINQIKGIFSIPIKVLALFGGKKILFA